MKNLAAQSMTLASAETLDELFSEDVSCGDSSRSRSTPIDAELMAEYLDALRCGVLLSG